MGSAGEGLRGRSLCSAQDRVSVVGNGENQNTLYVAGCSGGGVGAPSFLGRRLADEVGEIDDSLLATLRHATRKTPPQPLQWGKMTAIFAATGALDGPSIAS